MLDDYSEVGIVCPVYFYGVPNLVKEFVSKLKGFSYKYYFAVLTYGGMPGNAISSVRELFNKNGLRLNYATKIMMPDNYIVMFSLPSDEKIEEILEEAKKTIVKVASDISMLKFNLILKHKNILDLIHKIFSSRFHLRSRHYRVSNSCIGCGTCVSVCTKKNIALQGGRPYFGTNCDFCLACMSWCPNSAINYSSFTTHRTRFRNPLISLDELIAKRNIHIAPPKIDEDEKVVSDTTNNTESNPENTTENITEDNTSAKISDEKNKVETIKDSKPNFISKPKPIFDETFDLKAKK